MSREAHVRFCESLGLKCPGPLTEAQARKRFGAKHGVTAKREKKFKSGKSSSASTARRTGR